SISPMQYQHLTQLPGVASVGIAFSGPPANIAGGNGSPVVVSATYIDQGVLPTLGLRPILGRNFDSAETVPNGPHVALLSHDLWKRRFGSNPDVLGQTLQVNGHTTSIVGILPAAFGTLSDFSASIVLPFRLSTNSSDDNTNETAVARLAPGALIPTVSNEVNARLHAMYASMGNTRAARYWSRVRFGVQPLAESQNASAHATLVLFLACALFVLLTALVNLVNLMLLRSLSHAHDSAVRGALGAPPLRLALPSLAEGLLVGVIGALVGTGLAWIGLHALDGAVSTDWLPSGSLHMPWWMWLLALLVAIIVATGAAALGVWRTQATSAGDELREGGRSGLGRHAGRLGRVLVVVQMVLATVLLCGTGLLLHGLYKAASTPLGFDTQHILAFDLAPLKSEYPNAQAVEQLSQRLVRHFERIPGVTTATATTNLPSGTFSQQFNMPAQTVGGRPGSVQYRAVGLGFFKLFGITTLRGRTFTRGDMHGDAPVAVVSQALADHMYGGHALGELIQQNYGTFVWTARIVGVVGNTRQFGPLSTAPPILYVPLAQVPKDTLKIFLYFMPMRFVLRGDGNPLRWEAAVRKVMTDVAPGQPISNFRTMNDVVRSTTASARTTLLLVGVFAALALLLAVAGMYAVMAVSVTAREREFGIRTALGATPSRLTWLVLRGGIVQIVIGLVLGIAIVLSVSGLLVQILTSLIDRANTFDPVALIGTCIVLAVAGVAACLLPAWRAGRVQPMNALRGE
ncbi:MAG TPA: ABC transporter permease, partial [Nevskiaceae bacterium]|nr:ABC transporter permease [Nevskiaceae bacterium]